MFAENAVDHDLAVIFSHVLFLFLAFGFFMTWADEPAHRRKRRYLVIACVFAAPALIKALLFILLG